MRLSAHGGHSAGRRSRGPVATAATTCSGACPCPCAPPPHSVLRAPPSAFCGARRRGERCATRAARGVDDACSGHGGVTRRNALLALTGGASAAAVDARPTSAATLPMAETAAAQRACAERKLSGPLAAAFNGALFTTLVDLGLGSEGQLQREIFRLRDREYPYYYEANKDRLPRIPDLSDLSGGMSNTTYFNFNYYILFKVAARRAQGAELRTRLNAMYGQQLLPRVWEGAAAAAAAAAADGVNGRASQSAVLSMITMLLDSLLSRNYMCGYQVVWGEAPGTWPGDWMLSQARVAGEPADPATDARGLVFQVKIHEPADIKGSIALRAEEDGFWSRAVSSMVAVLLKQAGYGEAVADEYFFQDEWSGPTDLSSQFLMLLGDPLEMVDVPFVPSTLIQNYQL